MYLELLFNFTSGRVLLDDLTDVWVYRFDQARLIRQNRILAANGIDPLGPYRSTDPLMRWL